MNILIVTPFYKQDKNIASVRWTNLSARLSKKHNIIVVTQPFDDMDMNVSVSKEDNILVARVNQKTGYEKLAVKHFNGATGDDWQTGDMNTSSGPNDTFIRRLKNKVMFAYMKRKSKQYASYIVKNVIPKNTKIDVVISSACPFIEMLFGYELKKKLKCKWISDFRDLPFYEDNRDVTHKEKKIMRKVLPKADLISVVIPVMIDSFYSLIGDDVAELIVISNGFSKVDYAEKNYSHNDDVLHLGFTGTLYSDGSEFNMLFEAIRECMKQHPDFKCSIDCAGGNIYLAENYAKNYGVDKFLNNSGFVPRAEALKIQQKSDCLLAFSNAGTGGFGAKYYEYILSKKPVICVTYGENERSYAMDFVEELNLGIAVAHFQKDGVEKLKNYLLMQYDRKLNGEKMLYAPNTEKANEYDYDNIAKKLDVVLNDIIKE